MRLRDKLMHPATFISLAALFVALGGVGYAATKIGTKQLRNRAVTAPKLANNSVTSTKIRAGAVGNSDLANNSVSTQKIQAGAVISSDLAVDAVLGANLANGAVASSKIANGGVENHNLANGSVSSDKIGTGAVIAPKLAASSVTTPAIAPDTITAAQIVNGQVVEGNGTLSSTQATVPATVTPLLEFAGLGVLQGACTAGEMQLEFLNNSGQSVQVQVWGVDAGGAGPDPTFDSQLVANNGTLAHPAAPTTAMGATWTASFGLGAGLHLATITTSTSGCEVSAQATYTS